VNIESDDRSSKKSILKGLSPVEAFAGFETVLELFEKEAECFQAKLFLLGSQIKMNHFL
jgi:hypothetical protein